MAPPVPPPATGPIPSVSGLKIVIPNATIRLGIFLQPQFESAQIPTATGYANNLYLRRARFVAGGTLFDNVEWFLETDSPNLFKGATAVPAMGPGAQDNQHHGHSGPVRNVQVLGRHAQDRRGLHAAGGFAQRAPERVHALRLGLLRLYVPEQQSRSEPRRPRWDAISASRLRGLVVDGHIEYRVGIWQGQRNAAVGTAGPPAVIVDQSARNFFRTAARLQINIFDPETGYFYGGTYLGAKKILSLGGSYDFQSDYKAYSADGFLDMPLGPGVVTGAGRLFALGWGHLSPPAQAVGGPGRGRVHLPAGQRSPRSSASSICMSTRRLRPDTTQNRYAGGLAYWCYGHNSNLKLFYTRIQEDGAPHGANQINLQWQIFFY